MIKWHMWHTNGKSIVCRWSSYIKQRGVSNCHVESVEQRVAGPCLIPRSEYDRECTFTTDPSDVRDWRVSTWMWRLRVKNNKQIICWKRCVNWMKRLEVRNENKSHAVLGLGEIHGYAANIGSDGLKQLLSFTFDLGKFCFCFTTLTIFVNWLETAVVCREGKKVWFWKCWSGHSLRSLGCGKMCLIFELWEWQDASWAPSKHWLVDIYIYV